MALQTPEIRAQARRIGFHLAGVASVAQTYDDEYPERLEKWLSQGYQAEMGWMENPKRRDILQVFPGARSVISLGLNYYTNHRRREDAEYGKIARYGWGRDYHRVLSKKLKEFSFWLTAQDPGVETRFYVDTGPVSDKLWAQRAGLGWIGKNSNLISRGYGSWLFLGEILINVDLEPDRPHSQHCGTCRRCLDACPTGALPEPFVVDSRRCIAYHTIENRAETLPSNVSPELQGWVAGCDICQEVCPWNIRFARETDVEDFQPYPDNLAPKLTELAQLEREDWERRFPASALRRIKPAQWRRNARANLESQGNNGASADHAGDFI
ncbi:MAG: tRNA epoxyqueuosine(34) reductase QueG [Cyanobacteria bacterium RI_101]|nr:tRNA epoxyqueuosine(34) reductase QueG [Cyanobacteria bacterium RI_101]